MDRLARGGVLLDRHYVFAYCSPSRCALQTGRNGIHVNVVNSPVTQWNPADPQGGFQGAARNFTSIAAKLKSVGYTTKHVGKWNVGMGVHAQTPAGRGYDTALSYFDYDTYFWNDTRIKCPKVAGSPSGPTTDLWTQDGPAIGLNNTWDCSQTNQTAAACPHGFQDSLFLSNVLDFISNGAPNTPLFLSYAPHAPHDPYEVPNSYFNRFPKIDVSERRYYSAMVNVLDDELGALEQALKAAGRWDNALVVVSSDNGGPVGQGYGASSWPLRGGKSGNLEGGIRVNAFAFGGFLAPSVRGTVSSELIAIEDWWTTFSRLAGADTTDASAAASGLPPPDGFDMSGLFTGANTTSPRPYHYIGASDGSQSAGNPILQGVVRADGWKLLVGKIPSSDWQGPVYPNSTYPGTWPPNTPLDCGKGGCLFNVMDDPNELNDVASSHPALVAELKAVMAAYEATAYAPDRGTDDGTACRTAFGNWSGFMGPFATY
jgi:arylsulfatase B